MNSLRIFTAQIARMAAQTVRLPSLVRLACPAALLAVPGTGPRSPAQAAEPEDKLVREIFVPFDALSGV